jgi:polyhydroxyalkanoate synthesis regulator phasin
MQKKVALLPGMQQDITELKEDAKFDRSASARTDREVDDLKRRVTRLEAA